MTPASAAPLRFRWETLVLGSAGVLVVYSVLRTLADGLPSVAQSWRFLLVILGALVLGEVTRVRMPSGRVTAPIASGAGTALALTWHVQGQPNFVPGGGVVVAVCAVGWGIGLLVRRALGLDLALYVIAARLLGVALIAKLARGVDVPDEPLVNWSAGLAPWQGALALVAVACIGLLVELVLTGLVRAERMHTSKVAALADELFDGLGMTFALITAGPLIALLQPVLGLATLPLALFPMGLTYVAVHRHVANRQTYQQTIQTLSRLTEAGGYTPLGHAERVAHLSVQLGRHLGLADRELRNVEYAALLHDLGQISLRDPIPGGATVLAAPTDQQRIADEGASIIRRADVLDRVARYVELQSAPYRLVRERDQDIPLASRIIKVANAFDDLTGGNPSAARHSAALERIQLGMGYEYDPEVLEALSTLIDLGSLATPPPADLPAR